MSGMKYLQVVKRAGVTGESGTSIIDVPTLNPDLMGYSRQNGRNDRIVRPAEGRTRQNRE